MKWVAAVFALGVLGLLWLAWAQPNRLQDGPLTEQPRHSAPTDLPHGLSAESLVRLRAWLQAKESNASARPPERDIFQKVDERPLADVAPYGPSPMPAAEPHVPQLHLAGFVFRDRARAAIRFDGRVWLVGEGEIVGPYRVERIEAADEEVYLVDTVHGGEHRLSIE